MPEKWFGVSGSREFPEPDVIRRDIQRLKPGWGVVSGGAKGKKPELSADTVAAVEGRRLGLEVNEIFADWETHGRGAGMMRNTKLVEASTVIACYWDGCSKGTPDTLVKAYRAKKLMKIALPGGLQIVGKDIPIGVALAAIVREDLNLKNAIVLTMTDDQFRLYDALCELLWEGTRALMDQEMKRGNRL